MNCFKGLTVPAFGGEDVGRHNGSEMYYVPAFLQFPDCLKCSDGQVLLHISRGRVESDRKWSKRRTERPSELQNHGKDVFQVF